jgi:septum site-determining protein MinD
LEKLHQCPLGKKVLIVDGDLGLKNVDIFLGIQEYVTGDLCDLISEKAKPEEIIIKHPKIDNLFVIPSALSRDKENIDSEIFIKTMRFFSKEYDYTIIDSPHGIGENLKMILSPSNNVIVVSTPFSSSIIKSDKIIGIAEDMGIDQKNISLVINMIEEDLREEGIQKSEKEIEDILKISLLSEIPFDYDILSSNEKGIPISLKGNSPITEIFLNMAKFLDGEENIVPNRINTTTNKSFISKLLGG